MCNYYDQLLSPNHLVYPCSIMPTFTNRTVSIAQTVKLQWQINCNITNNERFQNLKVLHSKEKYAEAEQNGATIDVTMMEPDWTMTAVTRDVMTNSLLVEIDIELDVTVLSDSSIGNFLIVCTSVNTIDKNETRMLNNKTVFAIFHMRLGKLSVIWQKI